MALEILRWPCWQGLCHPRRDALSWTRPGITERIDFVMDWVPDNGLPPQDPSAPAPADLQGPTLLEALREQLGFKLEAARGPVADPGYRSPRASRTTTTRATSKC